MTSSRDLRQVQKGHADTIIYESASRCRASRSIGIWRASKIAVTEEGRYATMDNTTLSRAADRSIHR